MSHARIGRIRMKAGAEIVPLRRGAPIRSDRKTDFVNHFAASFDSHAIKYSDEPEAFVVVFLGLKQSAEAYWLIRGDSKGGGTSVLCLAQGVLQREIGRD
jgi:hypothetical protein